MSLNTKYCSVHMRQPNEYAAKYLHILGMHRYRSCVGAWNGEAGCCVSLTVLDSLISVHIHAHVHTHTHTHTH